MKIDFAKQMLIPPGENDPRIDPRMGILHVAESNADSLYDFFKNRSGGIESHGYIKKNGVLEQYRDTEYQADANLDANDFANSYESQGYANEPWTDDQLATIKDVMIWSKRHHGIPLRVVTSWDDPKGGWGYHTMFGAPSHWTPVVKTCPGPIKIKQFNDILVPWMKEQENDMFSTEDSARLKRVEAELGDLTRVVQGLKLSIRKRDQRNRERIANKFGVTVDKLDQIINDLENS